MGQRKAATRKRKFQETSSSGPKLAYDPDKFTSQKAWERYNEYLVQAVQPLRERGFEPDFGGQAGIVEQVKAMQWDSWAVLPEQGHLDLVREFYSNLWGAQMGDPLNTPSICKIKVRGKTIDFSAESLQKFLGLEGVDPKECPFEKMKGTGDRHVMSLAICTGSHLISTLGKGAFVTTKRLLKPEARVWMYIINTRILPSTNFSRITGDRITLLYCLMTGQKVHLRSIMFKELHDAARRRQLWFPALINKLCNAAGVPVKKGEERIPRANAIRKGWIQTVMAGGDVDAEDLGTDTRPVTQQRFTKSLNDRLDRIEAKQESLAKMIVHLGRQTFKGFKAVFEAIRSNSAPGPEEFEEPDITWFQQRGKERIEEDAEEHDEDDDEAAFLDEDVGLSG